jgi:hypothetical protein
MADFDVEGARKAGYSEDDILKHLTGTRQFDVEGARKAGYSNSDIISHLSTKPSPKVNQPPMSLGRRMVETGVKMVGGLKSGVDVGVGAAKGVGHTALGAAKMGEAMGGVPLFDAAFPEAGKARQAQTDKANRALAPTNSYQKAGYGVEQAAEYVAPLGEEKLIAGIPKGLQLISRVGLNALRTGATTTAQTGDVGAGLKSGAVAGGASLLFAPISAVMSKWGHSIQMTKINPRNVDLKDMTGGSKGFSEVVKGLNLKGNLAQSFAQVEDRLAKLRNARNALIAPGKGTVDLGAAFDAGASEVEKQTKALKFGSKSAMEGVDALRKDVEEIVSPGKALLGPTGKPIPKTLKVDIRKAENYKEWLGTLGAWAHGHPDAGADVKEHIANEMYMQVKNFIETTLGTEGPRVKALNRQMQRLIPVRNAMVAAVPREAKQAMMTISDVVAMMPGAMSGNPAWFALEGLQRAQKMMRFGNWMSRSAQGAATGSSAVARGAGGALAPSIDEMRRQREQP